MNKLELIQALKNATDLSKSEAAAVVDIFFNGMTDALAKGDRVETRLMVASDSWLGWDAGMGGLSISPSRACV